MSFIQTPPALGNQYDDDRVLKSYLARTLPPEMLRTIEPSLRTMGELAGGELYQMQLADRFNEPRHMMWDAWGNRFDEIEVSPLWHRAEKIAATHGIVATAYERSHGEFSRLHQFALAYLFGPSSDVYTCPLAMTDGAARTLELSGNRPLIERALPHLTSRDPQQFWTSGQWMTEAIGGSDVGLAESVARQQADGAWRLYGRKWFTSAATSNMALTLARPEGNSPGGKGLALFYLETRDAAGHLQNILVHRLKDKLGTRKVPTAELTLDGTPAQLVLGSGDGVRNIAPMLNLTRTWNSVIAVSFMRRGLALARDFARQRFAFGATLAEKPLHLDTLAGLQAETEAAFHLSFYLAEWIGRDETSVLPPEQKSLLRLLTPIVKLTTGKQTVAVTSEILECFGGAGYVEDTGLPALLRDAQVLPIWEGTTNVLSLDTLRALQEGGALAELQNEIERLLAVAHDPRLVALADKIRATLRHAETWLDDALQSNDRLEAGARRFALTLGRSLAAALLVRQAQWSLQQENDERALHAAMRFTQNGIDLIGLEESAANAMNVLAAARALALDESC